MSHDHWVGLDADRVEIKATEKNWEGLKTD